MRTAGLSCMWMYSLAIKEQRLYIVALMWSMCEPVCDDGGSGSLIAADLRIKTINTLFNLVTQVLHRCQESFFLFDSVRPLMQIVCRNTNLSLRLNILNFSKDTVKVNVELVTRQFS